MLSRTIETSIDIEAPPERVWDVLLDIPRWAEWNPFIPTVKGALEVDRKIQVKVVPLGRRPMEFTSEVWVVRPCREVVWGGSFLWIVFRGDHALLLERLPQAGTRFRQRERLRGLLVLLAVALGLFEPTERGYHQMNMALKQRVEARGREARD